MALNPGVSPKRLRLLADVAEMYYPQRKRQAEIARLLGVTTSMVSRLLTEAHQQDLVDIHIRRPIHSDHQLESELQKAFNIDRALVVVVRNHESPFLKYLGRAGAELLKLYLEPNITIGITWGTTLSALVDEFDTPGRMQVKLVEMVGALGSRNSEYEGHGMITRLAHKLGAEHYILNAPLLCKNAQITQALLQDDIVAQPLEMARLAQVALMGIGSLHIPSATVYRHGYFSPELMRQLIQYGLVGNVCGLYYDIHGQAANNDFCDRLITISKASLFNIPTRIAVAGGTEKTKPILGALRGGYINVLVTDNITAQLLLAMNH